MLKQWIEARRARLQATYAQRQTRVMESEHARAAWHALMSEREARQRTAFEHAVAKSGIRLVREVMFSETASSQEAANRNGPQWLRMPRVKGARRADGWFEQVAPEPRTSKTQDEDEGQMVNA